MRPLPHFPFIGLVLTACAAGFAQPAAPAAPPAPDRAQLEKEFERTMTGAVMVGSSAINGQAQKAGAEERYVIVRAAKQEGDDWLLTVRLQLEGRDLPLPLLVPVKWAGDTAVISVSDMMIPGMGTFTARVVVYGNQYAGVWSGKNHGGQLWGRIEHPNNAAAAPKTQPAPK